MRTFARVALGLFLSAALSVAADVTATKSVSGTFLQGTNVTYTIVVTNDTAVAQNDNPGDEFRDNLPPGLIFVSAEATSGTAVYLTTIGAVGWNGSIPAGGSVTITIVATISPTAAGTISNQGQLHFDVDGLTDDPSTAAANDATAFNVIQSGTVTATKSVGGTFVQGTDVTYTVVLTNEMTAGQNDNAGDEFKDNLPAGLTFVSAEATSGTAAYLTTIGAVGWNGSIPAGGGVTITIVCTVDESASGTISNQGQANFDRDGDGFNESSQVTDDPDTEADADATSFNVLQSGIVSATKSVSGSFVQGTNVTYTIVMTNNMAIAQNDHYGHEFTDLLPSGLTLVSTSATSGTAASCCGNIMFWDGSLAPGESVTITVVATIDANASGTISNQGQTIFDRDGDDVHNESSQVTDDPSTAAEYDATSFNVIQSGIVSATKSVSGSFVQGTNVTYTIVMTNNMTIAQNDHYSHEFTDLLPDELTLVSASATSGTTGSCCGNIVYWDGSLAPGESVTITVVATVDANASGTISNQGQTIFDRDGDDVHNESSQVTDDPSTAAEYDATSFNVIQSGIVTSTMSVSGTFIQGTNVTYTVVMTNNMTVFQDDNFGHEWTDILPSGLTLVSVTADSGTTGKVADIAFWDGSIPSGGTVTLTIVATISPTASGTISNQGQTIFNRDGDDQNESSQVTDDPSTAAAYDATSFNVIQSGIVSSTMSVSGTFVQGTDVTYTVVMTNNMTVTQDDNFGHEWTDILPSGLTLVSVTADSGTTGKVADIAFWDGSIPSGGTVTLTIVATISPTASGTVSNQGQTIFNRDGDDQNESSQVTDDPSTAALYDATTFNVIQSGIVTSTMSVSGTFVQGTDVTYTVVMTNNMTVTQPDNFGHEWTDNLPSGLTLVSVSASSGTTGKVANIAFWDGSLASGASATITIVATISSTATGLISNQGQTIFDRDGDSQNESSQITDDPSTAASYDATSFRVIQSNIVTSTMSVSGTFVQGTNVTYTVVMTNNMTVTQPDNFGHEWTDNLPSGLTLVSVSASSGTTGKVANIAFWDGSLASGASATLTIVATISPTATGVLSNQGQTIFDRDGDSQNESSQITDDPSTAAAYDATSFRVIQSNIVTSTMSVSGTFIQGTDVTYTVVMTNNMTVTQPDNFGHEWTDNLPSGLTLVSVSASSGTTGKVANIAFWDGSLASGASATITIVATISPTATGVLSNQGQTIFDRDGDSQNESSQITDDPSTTAAYDATSFRVIQSNIVTSTMSVSGTFIQGTNVTYTVVMTNNMTVTQPDNFGHEWTDNLPSGLTLVSVSASSGTTGKVANIAFWDGSLASGGSATITIVATISPTATGLISNQGQTIFDRDGDGQNESSQITDDPSTAASYDATSFRVIQSNIVSSTMSVSGTFVRGTNVTYTVVITNNMTVTQPDNFGHEWTNNLPSDLTLVSVSATSGTTGMVSNIAFWDGSIASGASVTLTIVATISSTATGTISNQGQTIFDRDGDGQNESEQPNDATTFTVIGADLSLAMSYLPSTPGQLTDVTYTMIVTNDGPQTATNVVVSDDRPDTATFVSASSTQGSCTTADPVVCSVGSLASGASATITLILRTPAMYDSMTNTATATADQFDPTPASASAVFSCMKTKNGKLKPCSQGN